MENIKLYTYQLGELNANCYVLVNENGDAVAIDIGGDSGFLKLEEIKHNFKIKVVLLTHGHYDHISGVKPFKDRGAKVYIGEKDEKMLTDTRLNLSAIFGGDYSPFTADCLLKGGEEFEECGITFKTIATEGHSEGGICYLTDIGLFSGDILFNGSFGRYDFQGGDVNKLLNSIKTLFSLDDKTKVYSGHGSVTTIGQEKEHNPINYYYD